MEIDRVLADVRVERHRQVQEKGYTPEHDAHHKPYDWLAYLTHEMGEAVSAREQMHREGFRNALIKVAAVAVAAVESMDAAKAGKTYIEWVRR